MKKFILPLAFITLIACEKPASIDYALFSGKLENSDSEDLTVKGEDFKKQISIKDDGTFSDTLFIENEGYYSFSVDNESSTLYLTYGTQLHLEMDVDKFDESIVYTGNSSVENNVLAKSYLINEQFSGSTTKLFTQEEDEFIRSIQQLRDSIGQLIQDSGTSIIFKQQQLAEAKYGYALFVLKYEKYHGFFIKNREFEVSESFANHQIEFSTNDTLAFKTSNSYQDLLKEVFSEKVDAIYEKISDGDKEPDFHICIIEAAKDWNKGPIKDGLLNNWADYLMTPNENLKPNYDYLVENTVNDELKVEYAESLEKLKKLAKGMPSPEFTDYENHAGGTISLSDLKGKYTYIDVWATWCGPCIGEIPSLKAVEEEFHSKNIQFVSASIDTEKAHETWVNMVNEKELGGIQLMADQAWQSKFVRDYKINGIPRFILIDPEGNIVSADAPRPSDPKLKELFAELNI
ncbi:MAG: TlpA family protein disulfide reductase [Flavobacteriales bacterium]|nr:TlpA family protein disulfide reductase [Flavobacteriales bacterium]